MPEPAEKKTIVQRIFAKLEHELGIARKSIVETCYGLRSRRRKFTEIFETREWTSPESESGPGSTLDQTRVVRETLPELIDRLDVQSLLDIPCGDFHWMQSVPLETCAYTGADIVDAIVQANNEQYSRPDRRFLVLDIVKDPLPQVDLILCRDCLVHLSNRDVFRAIGAIKQSGSRYLLTTTFTDRAVNRNIPTGRWRAIDLEAPPFEWPPPEMTINEQCTEFDGRFQDKSLGLWQVSNLPDRR